MNELKCRIADWFEIVDWFKLEMHDDDKINADNVRSIFKNMRSEFVDGMSNTDEHKFQVDQLKRYVKSVAKADHGPSRPIWLALARVKEDDTFLQFLGLMLEYLWV